MKYKVNLLFSFIHYFKSDKKTVTSDRPCCITFLMILFEKEPTYSITFNYRINRSKICISKRIQLHIKWLHNHKFIDVYCLNFQHEPSYYMQINH